MLHHLFGAAGTCGSGRSSRCSAGSAWPSAFSLPLLTICPCRSPCIPRICLFSSPLSSAVTQPFPIRLPKIHEPPLNADQPSIGILSAGFLLVCGRVSSTFPPPFLSLCLCRPSCSTVFNQIFRVRAQATSTSTSTSTRWTLPRFLHRHLPLCLSPFAFAVFSLPCLDPPLPSTACSLPCLDPSLPFLDLFTAFPRPLHCHSLTLHCLFGCAPPAA